jgi:hypothetical protein
LFATAVTLNDLYGKFNKAADWYETKIPKTNKGKRKRCAT